MLKHTQTIRRQIADNKISKKNIKTFKVSSR